MTAIFLGIATLIILAVSFMAQLVDLRQPEVITRRFKRPRETLGLLTTVLWISGFALLVATRHQHGAPRVDQINAALFNVGSFLGIVRVMIGRTSDDPVPVKVPVRAKAPDHTNPFAPPAERQ